MVLVFLRPPVTNSLHAAVYNSAATQTFNPLGEYCKSTWEERTWTEESWMRGHGGAIVEAEPRRSNYGDEAMEEESRTGGHQEVGLMKEQS